MSWGYKVFGQREAFWGSKTRHITGAFIEEISVLLFQKPAEPLAQVLWIDRESPAARTTSTRAAGEVIYGDGTLVRRYFPNAVLAVGGKPLLRTRSGQAVRREGRDYLIDQGDGSQIIYSAEGYSEALHDGTLGVR